MSQESNENQAPTKSKFDTNVHPEGARPFNDGTTLPDLARENPDGTLETNLVVDHDDISVLNPDNHEVDFKKVEALPKKSRRGLYTSLGSAAAAVGLTATAFLTLGGNSDNADKPRTEPSISAAPNPETQAPDPVDSEVRMLSTSGTAEEVLGNYDYLVSEIINERANAGVPVSTGEDFQYLFPTELNPADAELFDSFVQRMANDLVEARKLRAEHKIDADINFNMYSNLVSSEPTADGGFVVVSKDEYWAVKPEGGQVGTVTANLDPHRYTFSRTVLTLPDGSQKDTLVLSGFENIETPASTE